MIQICPAILVDTPQTFDQQFNLYEKNFDAIDIDINVPDDEFEGKVTVLLDTILPKLQATTCEIRLHLMVDEPIELVERVEESQIQSPVRYIVHQETKFVPVLKSIDASRLGVAISVDASLRSLDFYEQFSEVQFMTVETGHQGNPFIQEVLAETELLRGTGYNGIISLDGGINLQTSANIRNYPVNRVSVGSYFSKSEDIVLAKSKLELALNM